MVLPAPTSRWKFDEAPDKSQLVFESGTGVTTGTHGDHSFVFESGTPIQDTGESPLVFESGTGVDTGGSVGVISTAADATGYNDGAPKGSVEGGLAGQDGTAFGFTHADDDYIDTTSKGYSIGGGYAFSCWVYYTGGSDVKRNVLEDIDEVVFLETRDDEGGDMGFFHRDDADTLQQVTTGFTYNSWEFFTIVWDGAEMVLYLNGSSAGSAAVSSVFASTITLYLASDSTAGTQTWEGRLDDPRMWEQPLTASEVAELYNSY